MRAPGDQEAFWAWQGARHQLTVTLQFHYKLPITSGGWGAQAMSRLDDLCVHMLHLHPLLLYL